MKVAIVICFILRVSLLPAQDTARIEDLLNHSKQLLKSNTDSSFLLARKALSESQKMNYLTGEAKSYSRIATAFKQTGEYDSSLWYYRKNLEVRQKQNYQPGIASVFQNIGLLYKQQGIIDSAIFYLNKAYGIQHSIHQDSIAYNTLAAIANIERDLGHFGTSEKYLNECLHYYHERDDQENIANTMINLGNLYDTMGDTVQSRKKYYEALQLLDPNNKRAFENIFTGLANSYFKSHNSGLAILYANKSLQISTELGNVSEEANMMNTIGSVYMDEKNYIAAIQQFESAKNIFLDIGDFDNLEDVYDNLTKAYANSGNYEKAYQYLSLYQEIEDSISSRARNNYIDSISMIFGTEKTRLENISLQKDNEKNKLQKRIATITAISLSFLLLTILLLFLQQKRINKKKALLAQQQIQSLLSDQELKSINAMIEGQDNERKRIAEDLHDRVGSILSTIKLYFGSLNSKIDTYQDENKQQYEKANLLLDEAVQEVRRISHNLISGILMKFGLVPALRDLCDTVDGTHQLKTNLKVFHVDERMDGQTEISIYRIIQELLSNVLKHAKATEVTISLTRNDGSLNIIVEDNGKGFDSDANYDGIGLKNIRSRVEKLNGQIKFDSVIDRGTTVIIDLPIDETPNEV